MSAITNIDSLSTTSVFDASGQNVTVKVNKHQQLSEFYSLKGNDIIDTDFSTIKSFEKDTKLLFPEGVSIQNWKNVLNVSSRLLAWDDEKVLLECLIDKEAKIYEEREFKKSLFENMELKIGKLFKLCFFERLNQEMLEVKDNPKLISESDFKSINFKKEYSGIPLKKTSK